MKKIILLILLFSSQIFSQWEGTKYEDVFGDDSNSWSFTFSGSTAFQLQQLQGTGNVTFYWGDGTKTNYTLTSSDQTISHTYATTNQYTVRVANSFRIKKLYGSSNAGTWGVDTRKLRNLKSLTWFSMTCRYFTFNSQYHTGLTYFLAGYLNTGTISITFNSQYHTGLTYFMASNLNTGTISITFNSQYHTGLTYFLANNLNTGTISITFNSQYHTGLTSFQANNLNTGTISITNPTHTWSNSLNYFYLIMNYGNDLTAADVDQLIIDLDSSTWTGTSRTLRLTGSKIAAPTATSATALENLRTVKNVAVTTN